MKSLALSCCLVTPSLTGCAVVHYGGGEGDIRALLDRQAVAWNAGEVETFMSGYWKSSELTFSSGGHVTRGWESTLQSYRRRYPDQAAMGRLSFSELEVTLLSTHSALVLGRWHLDRDEPVGGIFTLVLHQRAGKWEIIHDHTSRNEP